MMTLDQVERYLGIDEGGEWGAFVISAVVFAVLVVLLYDALRSACLAPKPRECRLTPNQWLQLAALPQYLGERVPWRRHLQLHYTRWHEVVRPSDGMVFRFKLAGGVVYHWHSRYQLLTMEQYNSSFGL